MQRSDEATLTIASTAPRENASEIYLCPSLFSPFSAKKIDPGFAWLESNTGAEVTVTSEPLSSPPTISAISDAFSAIIASPRSPVPELSDHRNQIFGP